MTWRFQHSDTPGWRRDAAARPMGARPSWTEGYTADTFYTDEVVAELTPTWLSMVAVFHGQPPINRQRRLTWLDIGCGTGVPAATVAASNPDVDVWGVDYNPAHLDRAQGLVDAADLANCQFVEASFQEFANDLSIGPPEVDVVVVNGVYSWVSKANQQHITEVIRRRLRPGGLAYIMYETPAGWSSAVPLAEALRLQVEADGRPGHLAFHDAAATVASFLELGTGSVHLGPREAHQVASWAKANPFYAAHEYLGEHFGPLMVEDVAAAMAQARCSFVGTIEPTDHISNFWAPPGLSDFVGATGDPILREMFRDLIGQRPLRRDVYRRGLAVPTPAQHEQRLRGLMFVGLGRTFEEKPIDLFSGQISLDVTYHQPLTQALASHPLDVAAVLEMNPGWSTGDAANALALQVAAGYAVPFTSTSHNARQEASNAAHRLNSVFASENELGADHSYLISPTVGGTVGIDSIELLAIHAVWRGHSPDVPSLVENVTTRLSQQGRLIRENNELIEDPAAARIIVERRVTAALAKMDDLLPRLGIE